MHDAHAIDQSTGVQDAPADTTDAASDYVAKFREIVRGACMETAEVPDIYAAVVGQLQADTELLDGLREAFFRAAILQAIYDARHNTRRVIKGGRTNRGASSINSLAPEIAGALLDKWVVPGHRLGDLTGAMLDELATNDHMQASGLMINVRFYKALRKLVGPDECVRDKVSNTKAEELLESSRRLSAATARQTK